MQRVPNLVHVALERHQNCFFAFKKNCQISITRSPQRPFSSFPPFNKIPFVHGNKFRWNVRHDRSFNFRPNFPREMFLAAKFTIEFSRLAEVVVPKPRWKILQAYSKVVPQIREGTNQEFDRFGQTVHAMWPAKLVWFTAAGSTHVRTETRENPVRLPDDLFSSALHRRSFG